MGLQKIWYPPWGLEKAREKVEEKLRESKLGLETFRNSPWPWNLKKLGRESGRNLAEWEKDKKKER